MSIKEIELGYETLYKAVEQYQNDTRTYFFQAYVEVMKGLTSVDIPVESDHSLYSYYETLFQLPLEKEEKRKVTQLVLLKGMNIEPLQPNHQLTPDTLGFLFVYLIESLIKQSSITIYDPCNGMGNLLLTIMENLQLAKKDVTGYGAEIDDLLLEISAVNADWCEMPVQLIHQDGAQAMIPQRCDVVVADLPIGYYPLDDVVQSFKTAHQDGHSYAHHILMEASMTQLKETGYGLFLVPSQLLASEQANEIKKWFNDTVYIQAMLHLPSEMFKSSSSQKSILIVQNRNEKTEQVDEVLVAEIPSLNDKERLQRFFSTFDQWNQLAKGE